MATVMAMTADSAISGNSGIGPSRVDVIGGKQEEAGAAQVAGGVEREGVGVDSSKVKMVTGPMAWNACSIKLQL